ncbi:hypothetical protein EYF80_038629 [Liparis tanakae]|uniref:Uncharacterized protein n=1 Tax=Liparis tanakae TaxID=230148 RepID=A0A4Z2GCR0_9TELE|nr:hypothetical protein EYF80_038629 [Liparis tanakae]
MKEKLGGKKKGVNYSGSIPPTHLRHGAAGVPNMETRAAAAVEELFNFRGADGVRWRRREGEKKRRKEGKKEEEKEKEEKECGRPRGQIEQLARSRSITLYVTSEKRGDTLMRNIQHDVREEEKKKRLRDGRTKSSDRKQSSRRKSRKGSENP